MTTDITNPAGALGQTATVPQDSDIFLSGEASTTIAKGQVVYIQSDGTIKKAGTSTSNNLCIGVALEAIAAGKVGRVATGGYITEVAAQGTINAGDMVGRSGSTAGSVAAVASVTTGAASTVLGVALGAAASSKVTIWWFKTLGLVTLP